MEGRTQKLEHHHAVESWREVAENEVRRYHQKEDISLFIWFGAQQADFGEFNFGHFFAQAQNIKKSTEERVQKVLFLIRETRICEFEGGPVRFKSK